MNNLKIYLICPKRSKIVDFKRLEILAESPEQAIIIAKYMSSEIATLPNSDIEAVQLFTPMAHVLPQEKVKQNGIIFFKTKKPDGSYVDHFCIVNDKLVSISCTKHLAAAIEKYKESNEVTYKYSGTLIPLPLKYVPYADQNTIYILNTFTGEKKKYSDVSFANNKTKSPFANLPGIFGEDVRNKCLELNNRSDE